MKFLILILIDILIIFYYFYGTIKIANIVTSYLEKYISNQYALVLFHIYIICLSYYMLKQILLKVPVPLLQDGLAVIIVGPMIGTYSHYFVPFMKNVLK